MKIQASISSWSRVHGSFCLAASLLLLPMAGAHAATLWYDGGTANISTNGDGVSQTATGNWNTTTTNWDRGNGLSHINWDNTNNAGDTAFFGGVFSGTYTVTIPASGINVGSLIVSNPSSGSGRVVFSPATATITLGVSNSAAVIDNSGGISSGSTDLQLGSMLAGSLPGGLTLIGAKSTYAASFNVPTNAAPTRINLVVMTTSNNFVGPVTVSGDIEMQAINTSTRWDMLGVAANNVTLNNGTLFLYTSALTKIFDHNITVVGTTNALNMNNAYSANAKSNSVSGTITSASNATMWSAVPPATILAYFSDLSGFNGTFIARGVSTGTNLIDGTSAFGGTFMVDSGVLQIGNNDTSGSLGNNNLTNNGTILYNRTDSQTFAGGIAGKGMLNVNNGSLTLSGVSTYTNNTTVTGTLTISGAGQLGGGNYPGAITNNGSFVNGSSANQTYSGVISGAGSLTQQGAGTLVLLNTNTYAGNTTISAGTLEVDGSLASPNVIVSAGSTLAGAGAVLGAVTINNGGAISANGATPLTLNTLTLGSAPTDNLILTLKGDGNTVAGFVTVTGGVVNNGTVTVNVVGALPAGTGVAYTLLNYSGTTFSGTGNFVVGSLTSGVMGYVTNNTAISAIQLVTTGSDYLIWNGLPSNNWDLSGVNNWKLGSSGAAASFQNSELVTFDDTAASFAVNLAATVAPGGVIVSNNANNYTISGSGKITGGTTLIKNGTGSLTLATLNNFTAQTTINGGTVQLGDGTANNGSVGGNIVDNGALVFANPAAQTYSGAISGSGTIAKQSAGALTVSGNNTYDGATTISDGTFVAGSTNALGSTVGATTVSGGTLDVNGKNLGAESVNISGTGIGGNGVVINNGAAQLNALQNLALNSAATIGGSNRWDVRANGAGANLNLNGATLTKIGTNDIALVGVTVSDGNIVVNQGRFGLQSGTIFPAGLGQITVNPAGTLWIGDFGTSLQVSQPITLSGGLIQADSGTTATLGSPITLTTNSVISAGVPITLSQPIGGTGVLTKAGSSTLILDNPTNTWTGGLVIAAGTLQLGNNDNNGPLPPTIAVVTNNGVLAYSQTTDFTFTQPMVGTGGLGQYGPNTITITNQQSYTGSTVLANGTLRLAAGNNTLSNATVLSFTGGSTLDMVTNSQTVSGLTLTGNGTANITSSGTLNVLGVSPVQLGSSDESTPTLNLALNGFSYTSLTNGFSVSAPAQGQTGQPAATGDGSATVNLALTNSITAGQFGVADKGAYPGYNSTATVNLGQVNTINANTVAVGYANSGWVATGTLDFQGSPSNPTLTIRDATGTGRANMYVGYLGGSSYAGAMGTVDLYNGVNGASTLDALVGTLIIGQHDYATANQNHGGQGSFIMGNGLLDALNIVIGQKTYNAGLITTYAIGTFALNGGTVKVQTMTIGNQAFTNGPSISGEFDLNSGTLAAQTVQAGAGNAGRTFNWGAGTIQNYDANTDLAINGLSLNLGGGPLAFNIGAGRMGVVNSSLNGGTPITQTGSGTLVLSGNNSSYGGSLTNQAGAIYINGPLSGSVEAYANTVVGGSNSVASVQVDNGATVQAGDLTGAGILTVSTLNLGVTSTDLTQSRFNLTAGGLIAANSLTVNGTNMVNITGASVAVGTNNLILYSGSIGGSGINGFKLGSLPGGAVGHLQDNPGVAVQLVITSNVSTTPVNLTATVSGNTLNLSWPTDHLGWRLEAQTNSLNMGLSTNWVTVPGSASVTSEAITINPAAPTVFFHLVYP